MQDKLSDKNSDYGREILKNLSNQDFLLFGINQIAYIRPTNIMGHDAYALHGADGSALAVIESFEGAIVTARQNDMEPVTLQ